LFVTAVDTEPLCPDPRVVIAADPAAFDAGLTALTRLVSAPVFLCRGPGAALPTSDPTRVTVATFHGPHPAGLVGTHAHFLMPVNAARSIWHVGYQEVMAIGRTLIGGRPSMERVVALAGPLVRRPRLVRTRVGAAMDDLLRGNLADVVCRVLSGSVLSGRIAAGAVAFLGAAHRQVCVLAEVQTDEARGGRWSRPWSVYGAPWRSPAPRATTTARRGEPEPMVPVDTFDRVMPLDLLATPLLRALLVGDVERAEALGCLELEEEDLALCTLLCPSRIEYGSLLRRTLGEIERRT
jgi:Na+-transporting NADH:ubiquinone oxidoreductase subunit A